MSHPLGYMYENLPLERVRLPQGLIFPVKYAVIRRMMNNHTYGMVRRRRNGRPRPHQGWDFYAPAGYRCYAIANGRVAAVRNWGAFGKHVVIEFRYDIDGDGKKEKLYAAYCHLSRTDVRVGDIVRRGQVIGLTGNTGNAGSMRGPDRHLHFEIRTTPLPGLGLVSRLSPNVVFKNIPMRSVMTSV